LIHTLKETIITTQKHPMHIPPSSLYSHPAAFGHDLPNLLFAKRVNPSTLALPPSETIEEDEDHPTEIYFAPGLGLEHPKAGPNPAILAAIQSILKGEELPVFMHFGVDYRGGKPDCEDSLQQRSLWFRARIAQNLMVKALHNAFDRGHRALFVGHSIGSNSLALGQALTLKTISNFYGRIAQIALKDFQDEKISQEEVDEDLKYIEEQRQKKLKAFPAVLLLNPAVHPLQYPEVVGDHAAHFEYRKGKYPRQGKRGPYIVPELVKSNFRRQVSIPPGRITEAELLDPELIARRHVLQTANDPFLTERMTEIYSHASQTRVEEINGIGSLDHLLISPGRSPKPAAVSAVRHAIISALEAFQEKTPHQTEITPHPRGRKLHFESPAEKHPHVLAAMALDAQRALQT
jgi:hypothetical protein